MDPNKTVKNRDGVAHESVRYFEVTAANFSALAMAIAVALPPDCEITGGFINVTEAFDGVTSDVVDLGDALDPDRYAADVNLKAVGLTALVPTGFIHGADGAANSLVLTRTAVGGNADATGKLRLCLRYVELGKSYYTQD